MASRSLAPPGYSFHGIGDFDVGSVGLGIDNFTRHFTKTDVFKKLQDLDYVRLRYTESNRLGVRFEPWHIKVIT
ncbi:MAG: D-alanyl-D-alanine carboxypeptidase family protein [Deltaproteobacteria bacterium]|nr:D-alanyl-D-alanine carboxypeptidase family protein [Deltaproteobacteria bacterium]